MASSAKPSEEEQIAEIITAHRAACEKLMRAGVKFFCDDNGELIVDMKDPKSLMVLIDLIAKECIL